MIATGMPPTLVYRMSSKTRLNTTESKFGPEMIENEESLSSCRAPIVSSNNQPIAETVKCNR